jgi:succinoglycan biosynthesis transport protein ExoP
MELRDVRLALRRYWVLALLVLALCLALGAAAAFLPTKTYRAKAVITALIDPETQIGNPTSLIDYEMENITQRADSRAFLDTVGNDLSESDPDAAAAPRRVSSLRDAGSSVLGIQVESPNREATAVWANAVANTLIDDNPRESRLLLRLDGPAFTPSSAVSPQPMPILLGAGVLGLFLALLAAVAAARVRQALDVAEEVRSRFGAPVLGQIPPVRRLGRGTETVAALLEDGPPQLIEAFQSLRTNLDLLMLDYKPSAIAIASWSAGEGKSTVAAGLALSMAAVGRDVVVIDADLRRPTQHQRLGEPFGEGLADLGSMDVEQVLRRTRYEHLWYLPAGVPDRHPADVVTVTLPRAHRALAAEGRTLLIDAPPLHGVAETPFVLSVAHHVILVVDASSVKLIELEQAVERLRNSGLVLMGVVINRVRSQSHGATYDSYLLKADVAAENRRTTRPRAVEPPVPEPVEEPVRSNETELPPQSRLRFREG